MSTDGGGGGDKPSKPDPFAPLPLANLPPVRKREPTGGLPPTAFVAPKPEPEPQPAPVPSMDQAWSEAPPPPPGIPESGPGAPDFTWSSAPTGQQAWAEVPTPAAAEAPLLPEAYSENDLRAAVGATPLVESKKKPPKVKKRAPSVDDDDSDDGDTPRKSRKTMFIAALSIFVGSGIAALVFMGKVNSARYVIECEAERVLVEQGRAFPPWGTSSLEGAEWAPLKIPPEAACHPRETEDRTELAAWYLKVLIDQATKLLTAREVTKVDDAEAALNQALLVTRSLRTEDDAKNARGEIDRLLGDVVYWRASARLKAASDTLTEAAKQFDTAAAQRPAHFTDAAEWAHFSRKLIDQLRAGPAGAVPGSFPPLPPGERPVAPIGTALPVEPEQGSAASEPPPPAPDAGVPTGGVLL
ncbi:MAG: hypothetical protein H0T46_15660 [Deltaproteobacteria bacterium]|nr:hypothetical protein [Deltaproteobacteria bacterium]